MLREHRLQRVFRNLDRDDLGQRDDVQTGGNLTTPGITVSVTSTCTEPAGRASPSRKPPR